MWIEGFGCVRDELDYRCHRLCVSVLIQVGQLDSLYLVFVNFP